MERMERLEEQMNRLEEKIDRLLECHHLQEKSLERMDSHITFIERVYTQLYSPLSYIRNQISWMMGKKNENELLLKSE
jgi:hypothetical protein